MDELSQDEQQKPGQTKSINAGAPPNLANTVEAIEVHFKSSVQEFGKQYFGRKAAEDQKDAMEKGELTYKGHDHFSVAERLFRINDQLKYLGTDIEKFSEKEMMKKVIAKTLHPVTRLEYISRGEQKMTTKRAILNCVQDTQDFLNEEHKIGLERSRKFQPRNDSYHNNDTDEKEDNNDRESARDMQFKNPCRKHSKEHKWGNCPDNTQSKSRAEKKGEVSSTESQSIQKKTSFVRIKNELEEEIDQSEDEESSRPSLRE